MVITLSPRAVYALRCAVTSLGGATFLLGRRDSWDSVPFGLLGVAVLGGLVGVVMYHPDYRVRRDEALRTVLGPPTLRGTLGWLGMIGLFALFVRFAHPWVVTGQSAEAWFAGTVLTSYAFHGVLAVPFFGRFSRPDRN